MQETKQGIDPKIGQQYVGDVCEACKEKIQLETLKIKKLDYLRPKKLALRFQALICGKCKRRLIKKIKK